VSALIELFCPTMSIAKFFVLLLTLYTVSCFRLQNIPSIINLRFISKNFGYDLLTLKDTSSTNDHEEYLKNYKPYKEEIKELVIFYKENLNKPDLSRLIDQAHILSKGRLYEDVMDEMRSKCEDFDEEEKISKVDAFLKSFIVSERKSRARLKLNYLMAGATSNRLEQAVQMLSMG
jgi:hypothetical protein